MKLAASSKIVIPPHAHSFWWEVLSLGQRTTLTGWLLLIDTKLTFLRLLAALVVSVAFLVCSHSLS